MILLLLLFNDILGKLFNATHEVGFSRSKASSSGAISKELVNMELERGKYYDFDRNLDCLNRSQNHFYVYTEFATTCGVVSPGWKLGDSTSSREEWQFIQI